MAAPISFANHDACAVALSDRALHAYETALASEYVLKDEAAQSRADPYAFRDPQHHRPAAVVLPASVEELQAVLAVAREHRTPLWTVSTGKNLGYGGAAPRVAGSVVVDLQRMNRILEVNEELGYAVVEPGVRFLDLYAHLQQHGHKLMMSVPDIGWGSLIGNALERGFGYAPMWDHSASACGMEVMLADGRLLRTGMGAKTGSSAWHVYKGGFGPSLDGLLMQSNLGIVTRMGVWLMPRPETIVTCMLKAPRVSDLGPLIDGLRPLLLDGTIQSNAVIGNTTVIASMMSERKSWWGGDGAMPEPAVQAAAQGLHLGRWNARFGLYGHASMTDGRLAVVQAALAHIKGAEWAVRRYPGDVAAADAHPADHAQLGIPGLALLRMAAWRGGTPAHTDFSLVCPATAADAERQRMLIQTEVEAHGFDYAGGFTLSGRHAIALALLSFDQADAAQAQQVHHLFSRLIDRASAAGEAPYRAHLAFMDQISAQYDFNEHALRDVVETIKNALDPQGILSPGKQGLWPGRPGLAARSSTPTQTKEAE